MGPGAAQICSDHQYNRIGLEGHRHALLTGAMGGALVLVFRKATDNGATERVQGDSEKVAPEYMRREENVQLKGELAFLICKARGFLCVLKVTSHSNAARAHGKPKKLQNVRNFLSC